MVPPFAELTDQCERWARVMAAPKETAHCTATTDCAEREGGYRAMPPPVVSAHLQVLEEASLGTAVSDTAIMRSLIFSY